MKRVRLYYNSSAPGQRRWSVDTGAGTEEHQIDWVGVEGVFGETCIASAPQGNPQTQVSAWLQFDCATITIEDMGECLVAFIRAEDI